MISRTASVATAQRSSRRTRTPRSTDPPQRFVVFGDGGSGTPVEKAVAYRTYLQKPDYVLITGDIVYSRGRASEYDASFWPIYNAETASRASGSPLLRSTLYVAAAGNHDIAARDLGRYPDGLAYFFN